MSITGMCRNSGKKLGELAHFKQSIIDILTTPIGARIMLRDYVSRLFDLLDQPISASMEVKDALASTPGNGLVKISILSNSENGEASEELLETVRNHIMRDDVKMLTDTVEIVGCHIVPLDIVVEIKFANSFVSDSIRSNFIERFNSTKCLGWSPSISWIIANLFTDEVTHIRVISPEEDVQIASDECVSLNSLEFVL